MSRKSESLPCNEAGTLWRSGQAARCFHYTGGRRHRGFRSSGVLAARRSSASLARVESRPLTGRKTAIANRSGGERAKRGEVLIWVFLGVVLIISLLSAWQFLVKLQGG